MVYVKNLSGSIIQLEVKKLQELRQIKKTNSHLLEELLYVCARTDLLCERVENVESKIGVFDLIILWRVNRPDCR